MSPHSLPAKIKRHATYAAVGRFAKAAALVNTVARRGGAHPVVGFFPEFPRPQTVTAKFLNVAGYDCAHAWSAEQTCHVFWTEETIAQPPATPAGAPDPLNLRCTDISKDRVSQIQAEVFGEPLSVDPARHTGWLVEKSNDNALHDGRVIRGPVTEPDPSKVYQRLIDNQVETGDAEDIRVPVVGDHIPFIYLKHRPLTTRFENLNRKAWIKPVDQALSPDEAEKLLKFAQRIGLDLGEMDVLRDRRSGQIFVVDVSRTPFGPPNGISIPQGIRALVKLARAFERTFGSR